MENLKVGDKVGMGWNMAKWEIIDISDAWGYNHKLFGNHYTKSPQATVKKIDTVEVIATEWVADLHKYTTLVIHPTDISTDFLKPIYADIDCTVINEHTTSKKVLKQQIMAHDRVIMLGHGTELGLIRPHPRCTGGYIIDSKLVYLLRYKECICIWCNADAFFKKYGLHGLYTGMMVSEYAEAVMYNLHGQSFRCPEQVKESNIRFTEVMKDYIDTPHKINELLEKYFDESNPIVTFNRERIYYLPYKN